MDIPEPLFKDLEWMDPLLWNEIENDPPGEGTWTHIEAVAARGGSALAIHLKHIAQATAKWLESPPTAADLKQRRPAVFKALALAATTGHSDLFFQLERNLTAHYPRETLTLLEANVHLRRAQNERVWLVFAVTKFGLHPSLKPAKREAAIYELLDLRAFNEAFSILSLYAKELSEPALAQLHDNCLRHLNLQCDWTEFCTVTKLTSTSDTLVRRCTHLFEKLETQLSQSQRIDVVIQLLPNKESNSALAGLVRDVLCELGEVNNRRELLRKAVNIHIIECVKAKDYALAWEILYFGFKARLFLDRKKLPQIDFEALIENQGDPWSRTRKQTLEMLTYLSGAGLEMPVQWEAWFKQYDFCPSEERAAAVAAVNGHLAPEIVTETCYLWAIEALEQTPPTFDVAAAYIQTPNLLHDLPLSHQLRFKLLERMSSLDPDHTRLQMWKTLWAIEVGVPQSTSQLTLGECIAILERLCVTGQKEEGLRLALKTLSDPTRLTMKASITTYDEWCRLHFSTCSLAGELGLVPLLAKEFNPACYALTPGASEQEMRRRAEAAVTVGIQLLILAQVLPVQKQRMAIYSLLSKIGFQELFKEPCMVSDQRRELFAYNCAQIIVKQEDLQVAHFFVQALLKVVPDQTPSMFANDSWIDCNIDDQDILLDATLSIIHSTSSWTDERRFLLLILAQGLRSQFEDYWDLDIATELTKSDRSHPHLSALSIAMLFLAQNADHSRDLRADLCQISGILKKTSFSQLQDEQEQCPLLAIPVVANLKACAVGGSINESECDALVITALANQCQWIESPEVLKAKMELIATTASELCDRNDESDLKNICLQDIWLGSPAIPDAVLDVHPIYQLIRFVSAHATRHAVAKKDPTYYLQSLDALDRLADLTRSDPFVYASCCNELLSGLTAIMLVTASEETYSRVWSCFIDRLETTSAWWIEGHVPQLTNGVSSHRALRTLVLSLESVALIEAYRFQSDARRQELGAHIENILHLWTDYKWPSAEGSIALLNCSLLTRESPEEAFACLNGVTGRPLFLIQGAIQYLSQAAHSRWISEDRKTDSRRLSTFFAICEYVFSEALWVPPALQCDLARALVMRINEYTQKHGQHSAQLDFWWSVINRPERLEGLTAQALSTSLFRQFGCETDEVACLGKFGIDFTLSVTVREIAVLPFEMIYTCLAHLAGKRSMCEQLGRILAQRWMADCLDKGVLDTVLDPVDLRWLNQTHRADGIALLRKFR